MANTTSLTGLSKDILRKKYILEGFKFYLDTFHPEHNNILSEANNDSYEKVLNSIKNPESRQGFDDIILGLSILFDRIPDSEFKKDLQKAIEGIKNGTISAEDIKNWAKSNSEQINEGPLTRLFKSLDDTTKKGKRNRMATAALLLAMMSPKFLENPINNAAAVKFAQNKQVTSKIAIGNDLSNIPGNHKLQADELNMDLIGGDPPDSNEAVGEVVIQYDYSKSKLNDEAKKIIDQMVDNIAKVVDDGGDVEIEYGSSSSHTTGEIEKGTDTGGKKLKDSRDDNADEYTKDQIYQKLGSKASKIKLTRVEATDGKDLKKVEKGSNEGAFTKFRIKTPVNTNVKLDWKYWPEAIEREVSGRLTEPDGETPRTGGETPRTGEETPRVGGETPRTKKDKKSKTDVPPTPSTEFSKLNRNGQIATVLAAIDPKLNIAQYKEIGPIKSYSDRELLNPEIKDANAKELGRLIVTMRKNPDATLKKISTATGVSLKRKAKVRAKKQDNTIQSQEPSTVNESRELFLEAAIDDIFTKLGVQDDTINKNKDKVISYLKAMYASDESNDLDVIDKNKSKTVQADTKRALDIIASRQKELQPYFDRISNKQEFADFIVGIIKFVEEKLQQDASKLRSALFRLRNNLKEAEEDKKIQIDAQRALEKIQKNTFLVQALGKISNLDELEQFLAGVITYITKVNVIDKKNALMVASNVLTSDANKGPRSKTTEIQRMQELAGLKK